MPRPGKIFAIGDVHGCRAELEHLLEKLSPGPTDTIVFLGDLVNRGPESAGVLRLARGLTNVRCLLGNHELRLLKYRRDSDPTLLKPYDWDTIHQLNDDDWNFMATFEETIHFPQMDTVLVHGGFIPWEPWQEQPVDSLVNIQVVNPQTRESGKRSHITRGRSWQDLWEGPPFVICGHTPRRDIYRAKASLCLDTGCVYGGRLTACDVLTQQIFQVAAFEDYVVKALPHQ